MALPSKPAPIPKSHHFVAQMHSRRFTDAKGRFYLHNKHSGKTHYTNPQQAFAENHLYTKVDAKGAKNSSLETRFSKIEGAASRIIDKIVEAVRHGTTPVLSADERTNWDTYLYMQLKRTPDALAKVPTLQQADTRLTELFAVIAARGAHAAAEVAKLDNPAGRRRLIQSSKVGAVDRTPGDVLKALATRGVVVLHVTNPDVCFVIGSQPVARKKGSLLAPRAEIWLPVAPHVAVGIGGPPGVIHVLKLDDADAVRAFNRVVAAQSTSFASASKVLVDELAEFVAALPKQVVGSRAR